MKRLASLHGDTPSRMPDTGCLGSCDRFFSQVVFVVMTLPVCTHSKKQEDCEGCDRRFWENGHRKSERTLLFERMNEIGRRWEREKRK